jgi:hypothetical protein
MTQRFRIFWDNYVDLDLLAGSDVSSEQAAFPVTNAYNTQRRSKVWRSNGYFNVTSSNNVIVARETSGGPDLDATIAEAEYVSTTTFAAAIKTALEAVGDSTYTVTISEADGYRVKIVSNGSGGTGVFHLMLTDVGFTAASLLGFGTDADLTGASLTRTADFLRINSEEYIEWDMGLPTNPQGFCLIGARNSPIQLSPGGTYKLQGNYTSNWTSPDSSTTLTYADNAFFTSASGGLGTDSYRFWRVLFEDQNPNGYLEVGAFQLGDYFNPDRGRVQFPLQVSQVDLTDTLFSEGGQSYADIKEKTATYSVKWRGLKKEDIEEIENQFARYGTGVPFFVNIDADATYSTSSQRRVLFCKFASEPSYELVSPNNFECNMIFREEI